MAFLSHRQSENGINDPAPQVAGGFGAPELALKAVNALDRPLAVISSDGGALYHNSSFAALFAEPTRAAELRRYLAMGPNPAALYPVTAEDGRVFFLEISQLAEGSLVTADCLPHKIAQALGGGTQIHSKPALQVSDRQAFREHLRALLAGPAVMIEPAAVLLIHLDRYDMINDALGEGIGSKLLRLVAGRLRSAVSGEAHVAHFGAGQFAILEPDGQAHSVPAFAERLIDLIGRSYIVEGHPVNLAAIVGMAFVPAHGTDCDEILKNATLALRHAKQAGPGHYQLFVEAMNEEIQARRNLEIDLRRALALRELALVYQPQYNLASKQITGFEALLRWYHPERGSVSPGEFIPLAEELGLIVPIGEWVIRTACRAAARWPSPLTVAVNVSAIQFRSADLTPTIVSGLAELGLDPARLELEITESVLVSDHAVALKLLNNARSLGLRVAMDDFGTGYSSLSYLRSFPFDKIKIDQSFVRTQPDDSTARAIVNAIAALGHSLGIKTIAEGVETDEQLALVAASGCTDVQGYLISKPLAADKLDEFLSHPPRIDGALSAA